MDDGEWILAAILSCGLLGSVATLIRAGGRLRRSPEDRIVRFTYGWLGVFALNGVLGCCIGLSCVLAEHARMSRLAAGGVIAANLLAQPIASVMVWSAGCKLLLGLRGHVVYAWRRVPEEQLTDLPAKERSSLARYCVLQGVLGLAFGGAVSAACAWPLVEIALA